MLLRSRSICLHEMGGSVVYQNPFGVRQLRFPSNSVKSLPREIQIYNILAAHLFGPKPGAHPEQGKVVPKSYHELQTRIPL